jgi:hypothetical protein
MNPQTLSYNPYGFILIALTSRLAEAVGSCVPCHSRTVMSWHNCHVIASLPGKSAGQVCRASLPGKSAGQVCRASLPGKSEYVLEACFIYLKLATTTSPISKQNVDPAARYTYVYSRVKTWPWCYPKLTTVSFKK